MAWTEPRDWAVSELVTATMLNQQIRDNLNAMFPIGSFLIRAANYTTVETAVEGRWLQCNGVTVSRTTYAELFAWLNGLTPALPFGSGDGSTTFTLPDLRGRAPYGEGEHADVDAMGDSDGAAIGDRSPEHRHALTNVPVFGSSIADTPGGWQFAGSYTSGNSSMQDTGAYLVVGSWFIKYH